MVGRKRISPDQVKGVQTAFTDLSSELQGDAESLIKSDVTELFQASIGLTKTVSSSMMDATSRFNTYLNAVADEMEKADLGLKDQIDYKTSDISYRSTNKMRTLQDDYYKGLK